MRPLHHNTTPQLRYLHDMTILEGYNENDLIRLFNTVQELSEQLKQSRTTLISLHASAETAKVCLHIVQLETSTESFTGSSDTCTDGFCPPQVGC